MSSTFSRRTTLSRVALAVIGSAIAIAPSVASAQSSSAPVILQWFESRWDTIERRTPDFFNAGYGQIWTPPPGRADSGGQSVGYDVFDRFDLGSAGNQTLYGTETSYRKQIKELRRAGAYYYADLIWNHNGFRDQRTTNFLAEGGYPGFVLGTAPGTAPAPNPNNLPSSFGDFNNWTANLDSNPQEGRLAGLIDINQSTNNVFIRQPVTAGNAQNIPAGTLRNLPSEANRRFYQNRNRNPDRIVFNPGTGQGNIPVYDFSSNGSEATTGTPVAENATGLLMRYNQWMLQSIGVDGFRIDAQKHIPTWVFDGFYDLSVYRGNPRRNLDGSERQVFSFGEMFDGNMGALQPYIKKNINPNSIGTVGGNRDVKDFPLYFAMVQNLSGNGLQNDWRNVINASVDVNDDGFANNGSQGVAFAQSADSSPPALNNVAHAFMLMRPGNAIVYFNAKEFGTGRNFPNDGRGDALGGLYGNAITNLVDIRNRYGRGNFIPRLTEKETMIYERDKTALVVLSNRVDAGFDAKSVSTNFAQGTWLVELTGNATSSTTDPNNDIPDAIQVGANGLVNLRALRNMAPGTSNFTGNGYLIYGLPSPKGTLALTNVAQTIAGGTANDPVSNGTTRLASIDVVTGNTFNVQVQLDEYRVLGQFRDADADGDNALFTINGGARPDGSQLDLNGNGFNDFASPSAGVVYGFEQFVTKRSPRTSGGDGQFIQTVNTDSLVEGYNYLEVRAFRRRTDGGPAVYSSFKKTIYVDRLAPTSSISSFQPWDAANSKNRDLVVKSDDMTATQVNVFLNLPAGLTEAQILQRAVTNNENPASSYDRDLFKYGFFDVPSGNNVITIVTREITGNYSIRRIVGQSLQTNRGAGLGDLNFDGTFTSGDVAGTTSSFEFVMNQKQQAFNPAADFDGNGRITYRDLLGLRKIYRDANATSAATQAQNVVGRRGDFNGTFTSTAADIDVLYTKFGTTGDNWLWDLDDNSVVGKSDVDMLVFGGFETRYGDANLDKTVNFDDLLALAANYNLTGGWAKGDFNGDGSISFDDLLQLAANYNLSGPGADVITPPAAASFALAQTLVPEPTTLAMFGAGAAMLLSRRRRG